MQERYTKPITRQEHQYQTNWQNPRHSTISAHGSYDTVSKGKIMFMLIKKANLTYKSISGHKVWCAAWKSDVLHSLPPPQPPQLLSNSSYTKDTLCLASALNVGVGHKLGGVELSKLDIITGYTVQVDMILFGPSVAQTVKQRLLHWQTGGWMHWTCWEMISTYKGLNQIYGSVAGNIN